MHALFLLYFGIVLFDTGASAKVLGQSGKIDFFLNNQTMQVSLHVLHVDK